MFMFYTYKHRGTMWCLPIHRGTVWCVNILNECSMKVDRITTTDTLSSPHTHKHTHCTYTHAVLLCIIIIICTYIGIQHYYSIP